MRQLASCPPQHNTLRRAPLSAEDLTLPLTQDADYRAIQLIPNELITPARRYAGWAMASIRQTYAALR